MDHVFLPPKYLVDLQRADTRSLSFSATINDVSVKQVPFQHMQDGSAHHVDEILPGLRSVRISRRPLFAQLNGRYSEDRHHYTSRLVK